MARPRAGTDTPQLLSLLQLIDLAQLQGASDIHIEPTSFGARVRFRIYGILHDVRQYSTDRYAQLCNYIKVAANLDITEQRIAQDGRLDSKHYDIRVSFFPSLYGEKIVLRLLRKDRIIDLRSSGLSDIVVTALSTFAEQEGGMCLITGPTGSGKTTTLYGLLHEVACDKRNVVTLEDPIEYHIQQATQTQIQETVFPFSHALRSLLRQDPDVIMVGEMRDEQTALIACEAALTGHLVVSSLHTRTVAESIVRLLEMNIPAYVIAASLSLVVSQRLYQVLCQSCLAVRGSRCLECVNGISGRAAVAEVLIVNDAVRGAILERPCVEKMYKVIKEAQLTTFEKEVAALLAEQQITNNDAMRICGNDLIKSKI